MNDKYILDVTIIMTNGHLIVLIPITLTNYLKLYYNIYNSYFCKLLLAMP